MAKKISRRLSLGLLGSSLFSHNASLSFAQQQAKPDRKTWETKNRFMLAWHGTFAWNMPEGFLHPYPNGHPFSCQRADGKIVTTYYRTSDPLNYSSTVVEAVIWEANAPS
ncbi:MAG: hypothetical protein FJW26_14695 [Acidimicrobiia bacterium]|nr:hypothetical protein [Acidimicrobiia bacterium]